MHFVLSGCRNTSRYSKARRGRKTKQNETEQNSRHTRANIVSKCRDYANVTGCLAIQLMILYHQDLVLVVRFPSTTVNWQEPRKPGPKQTLKAAPRSAENAKVKRRHFAVCLRIVSSSQVKSKRKCALL